MVTITVTTPVNVPAGGGGAVTFGGMPKASALALLGALILVLGWRKQ